MKLISPTYINVKGRLLDLATPQVMGILNVTPDSFYSGSRMQTQEEIAARARQIIDEGASIIDIGAYSSRPGAAAVSEKEEIGRLMPAVELIRKSYPHIPVCMHQDHGQSPAVCQGAINLGFSSVMMDGSLMSDGKTISTFDYNVNVTKEVVNMAHKVGVSILGKTKVNRRVLSSIGKIHALKLSDASSVACRPSFVTNRPSPTALRSSIQRTSQ